MSMISLVQKHLSAFLKQEAAEVSDYKGFVLKVKGSQDKVDMLLGLIRCC